MSQLTSRLLDYITAPPGETIESDAAQRALSPLIDTVGVMLAGSASPAGAAVLRYAEALEAGAGPRNWLGCPRSSPPPDRALVAATLGNAFDFDDDRGGVGHPSSIILAALLTLAETRPISGKRLIESYVIGYETTVTVALGLGGAHYRHGWHTSGTMGGFGAAAAAAAALDLSREQTASALGLCASQAGGLQRNFGSMTKSLHSGFAARSGLSAALMAAHGITGDPEVIDGPRGLYEVYSLGESRPQVYDTIGAPLQIVDPGPTLKRYPCSYASHRAIDAALEIRNRKGFSPARIRRIECRVPTLGLIPLVHHRPTTGLHAKLSIEYVIAAALFDGAVGLASFEDSAVNRQEIQRLMAQIDAAEDPACRPDDPSGRHSSSGTGGFVDLKVELNDGSVETATVEHASGSPEKPMSMAEIDDKFLDCARVGGVPDKVGQRLLSGLHDLGNAADVRVHLGL